MAELAEQGKVSLRLHNLAVKITTEGFNTGKGLKQKDFTGEAKRILAFVRDDIRYVRDIDGVEVLHNLDWLLTIGAGDCDDKAMLLAAMLASIGHKTRFVAVAFQPGLFSHVWVQDFLPDQGKWIDLEATEPIPFGESIPVGNAVKLLYQDV